MNKPQISKSETEITLNIRGECEEWTNFVTHAVGSLLFLAGGIYLLLRIWDRPTIVVVSATVFVAMLVAVYASSALSHFFHDSKYRALFRKLDQAFIFILIVATYTPFSVTFLHDTWWWILLGLMWLVAITGFISKLAFSHRVEGTAIWIYLVLGWMPAFGGMPFAVTIPRVAIVSIVVGGIFYTAGTLFLVNDRKRWYFHGIWHIFVIAGSAIHYLGILVCL